MFFVYVYILGGICSYISQRNFCASMKMFFQNLKRFEYIKEYGRFLAMKQLIGIGLRHPHIQQVLDELPSVGWWEVHSENYFHSGGASLENLLAIREHYPVSLHGVGLSLGSSSGVDQEHLRRLKNLIQAVDPFLVSEHLSWSRVGGVFLPDLLPVPYTKESLGIISKNIKKVQDYLDREILIENPSSYLEFSITEMREVDFLISLCERTSSKILLDINNVFVSCLNHGWDMNTYLDSIPPEYVQEIHLAGHSIKSISSANQVRIDTHDSKVDPDVWGLYAYAISKMGARPTLLEWDSQIPTLEVLIDEADKALPYLSMGVNTFENT